MFEIQDIEQMRELCERDRERGKWTENNKEAGQHQTFMLVSPLCPLFSAASGSRMARRPCGSDPNPLQVPAGYDPAEGGGAQKHQHL